MLTSSRHYLSSQWSMRKILDVAQELRYKTVMGEAE